MSVSRHRRLQSRFQVLRFPPSACSDRNELVSIPLFRRLVLARRQQGADDGEWIHLYDLGPETASQTREELEPEKHPDFVGMGKSRGTPSKVQMIGAFLAYAGPSGSGGSSERGQPETSEFFLRCPGTCRRRRGRSIDRDPLNLPSHLVDDAIDCARDATSGFLEGRDRSDFLVADAARYEPGQVLRNCQWHQRVARRDHADRQSLTNGAGNVDSDVN